MCLGISTLKKFIAAPRKENHSIGESKVVNGIEYFNMGTIDDEDDWIAMGSAIIQYYVNVYEVSEGFVVLVEEKLNEKAINVIECYDYAEAIRRVKLLERIYMTKESEDFLNNRQ